LLLVEAGNLFVDADRKEWAMPKVTLYALSTCPWCRKAKTFFAERNIPFEFTDYDLADPSTQDRIAREMDADNAGGFPFTRIGDQVVEGYQPLRYNELLGL
jgi:glutaredoxin